MRSPGDGTTGPSLAPAGGASPTPAHAASATSPPTVPATSGGATPAHTASASTTAAAPATATPAHAPADTTVATSATAAAPGTATSPTTTAVPDAAHPPAAATSRPRGSRADPSTARLAPLDGIRAVAVVAVLLYHGGVAGVGGGLLGVDVFLVLSGYLITTLLCREHLATKTVALGRFWARRARRLLPALVVVLAGVAVYAWAYAATTDLAKVRGDALSSLAYVANWHFVLSDQGYFAQSAAPSPLLHLWSLGVEEQYYLIWPLVALVVLHRFGVKGLAWVSAVGAVASAAWMAVLFHHGASIDRLYYGTDTRAQALLLGSCLGAVAAHRPWRVLPEAWAGSASGRLAGTSLGLVGSAGLVWAFHAGDGQSALLYDGGFLAVALAAGAVLTTVTTWPGSVLARVLSFPVATFVGRISYGLYLYHWPLFLVIDHAHTGLAGTSLLAVRLAASLAVSVVSFVAVEQPIRRSAAFARWPARALAGGAVAVTAAALVVATVPPVTTPVDADAGTAIPAAERSQLVAAHAFTTDPVRFEIFGDSLAMTLSTPLGQGSVPSYGVVEYKAGVAGCDLDPRLEVRVSGQVTQPVPVCLDWPQRLTQVIDQNRPDVVGVLLGRMETLDHLYRGHWVHLGERVWDDHVAADLEEVVRVSASTGAKVAFLTLPYSDPPVEAPSGQLYPENQPSRVDAFNRVLRRVATEVDRRSPGLVTIVDLHALIDPQGHYAQTVDGVDMRFSDGIHISEAGGRWLQPRLLPEVAALGLSSATRRSTGTDVRSTTGHTAAHRP